MSWAFGGLQSPGVRLLSIACAHPQAQQLNARLNAAVELHALLASLSGAKMPVAHISVAWNTLMPTVTDPLIIALASSPIYSDLSKSRLACLLAQCLGLTLALYAPHPEFSNALQYLVGQLEKCPDIYPDEPSSSRKIARMQPSLADAQVVLLAAIQQAFELILFEAAPAEFPSYTASFPITSKFTLRAVNSVAKTIDPTIRQSLTTSKVVGCLMNLLHSSDNASIVLATLACLQPFANFRTSDSTKLNVSAPVFVPGAHVISNANLLSSTEFETIATCCINWTNTNLLQSHSYAISVLLSKFANAWRSSCDFGIRLLVQLNHDLSTTVDARKIINITRMIESVFAGLFYSCFPCDATVTSATRSSFQQVISEIIDTLEYIVSKSSDLEQRAVDALIALLKTIQQPCSHCCKQTKFECDSISILSRFHVTALCSQILNFILPSARNAIPQSNERADAIDQLFAILDKAWSCGGNQIIDNQQFETVRSLFLLILQNRGSLKSSQQCINLVQHWLSCRFGVDLRNRIASVLLFEMISSRSVLKEFVASTDNYLSSFLSHVAAVSSVSIHWHQYVGFNVLALSNFYHNSNDESFRRLVLHCHVSCFDQVALACQHSQGPHVHELLLILTSQLNKFSTLSCWPLFQPLLCSTSRFIYSKPSTELDQFTLFLSCHLSDSSLSEVLLDVGKLSTFPEYILVSQNDVLYSICQLSSVGRQFKPQLSSWIGRILRSFAFDAHQCSLTCSKLTVLGNFLSQVVAADFSEDPIQIIAEVLFSWLKLPREYFQEITIDSAHYDQVSILSSCNIKHTILSNWKFIFTTIPLSSQSSLCKSVSTILNLSCTASISALDVTLVQSIRWSLVTAMKSPQFCTMFDSLARPSFKCNACNQSADNCRCSKFDPAPVLSQPISPEMLESIIFSSHSNESDSFKVSDNGGDPTDSQTMTANQVSTSKNALANCSPFDKMLFLLSECAKYMVRVRLVTAFGKPPETLYALEKIVNSWCSGSHDAVRPFIFNLIGEHPSAQHLSNLEPTWTVLLMMIFFFYLENAVASVSIGNSMCQISDRNTNLFFRSNKKSFETLFIRLKSTGGLEWLATVGSQDRLVPAWNAVPLHIQFQQLFSEFQLIRALNSTDAESNDNVVHRLRMLLRLSAKNQPNLPSSLAWISSLFSSRNTLSTHSADGSDWTPTLTISQNSHHAANSISTLGYPAFGFPSVNFDPGSSSIAASDIASHLMSCKSGSFEASPDLFKNISDLPDSAVKTLLLKTSIDMFMSLQNFEHLSLLSSAAPELQTIGEIQYFFKPYSSQSFSSARPLPGASGQCILPDVSGGSRSVKYTMPSSRWADSSENFDIENQLEFCLHWEISRRTEQILGGSSKVTDSDVPLTKFVDFVANCDNSATTRSLFSVLHKSPTMLDKYSFPAFSNVNDINFAGILLPSLLSFCLSSENHNFDSLSLMDFISQLMFCQLQNLNIGSSHPALSEDRLSARDWNSLILTSSFLTFESLKDENWSMSSLMQLPLLMIQASRHARLHSNMTRSNSLLSAVPGAISHICQLSGVTLPQHVCDELLAPLHHITVVEQAINHLTSGDSDTSFDAAGVILSLLESTTPFISSAALTLIAHTDVGQDASVDKFAQSLPDVFQHSSVRGSNLVDSSDLTGRLLFAAFNKIAHVNAGSQQFELQCCATAAFAWSKWCFLQLSKWRSIAFVRVSRFQQLLQNKRWRILSSWQHSEDSHCVDLKLPSNFESSLTHESISWLNISVLGNNADFDLRFFADISSTECVAIVNQFASLFVLQSYHFDDPSNGYFVSCSRAAVLCFVAFAAELILSSPSTDCSSIIQSKLTEFFGFEKDQFECVSELPLLASAIIQIATTRANVYLQVLNMAFTAEIDSVNYSNRVNSDMQCANPTLNRIVNVVVEFGHVLQLDEQHSVYSLSGAMFSGMITQLISLLSSPQLSTNAFQFIKHVCSGLPSPLVIQALILGQQALNQIHDGSCLVQERFDAIRLQLDSKLYAAYQSMFDQLSNLAVAPQDIWNQRLTSIGAELIARSKVLEVVEYDIKNEIVSSSVTSDSESQPGFAPIVPVKKMSLLEIMEEERLQQSRKATPSKAVPTNIETVGVEFPPQPDMVQQWRQRTRSLMLPIIHQIAALSVLTLNNQAEVESILAQYGIQVDLSLLLKASCMSVGFSSEILIDHRFIKFAQYHRNSIISFLHSVCEPPFLFCASSAAAFAAINIKSDPTTHLSSRLKHWWAVTSVQLSSALRYDSLTESVRQIRPQLMHPNTFDAPLTLPGVGDSSITLTGADDLVQILRTKSSPRKIMLLGSDGRRYPFLLKGGEDMRSDARVMQIFRSFNIWLRLDSARQSVSQRRVAVSQTKSVVLSPFRWQQPLNLRTYSVIPMNTRVGLAQWVEHAMPLNHLLKSWQERELALLHSAQKDPATAAFAKKLESSELLNAMLNQNHASVFLSEMQKDLHVKSVASLPPRSQWSLATMRNVFTKLAQVVPSDLIRREMVFSAASPSHQFQRQQKFAQSVATTSIVGHLLGVGDRHLGNILLDIQSGELVHIDFAVVSDIGLRLRVPELASCRLSPNIIQALGPHSTTSSVSPLSWAAADTMACARVNNDALLSLVGSWLNEPFTQGVRSQGPLAQLCHKLETDICVKEICSRLSSSVFTKRINALIEQVAPLLASVRAVVQSASQEQESRNRINDLRELIQHNQTEAVQAETMLAQGRESVALMYAPHVCDAATATWQRRKAANDEIGRMRMELTQRVERHELALNTLSSFAQSPDMFWQFPVPTPSPFDTKLAIEHVISATMDHRQTNGAASIYNIATSVLPADSAHFMSVIKRLPPAAFALTVKTVFPSAPPVFVIPVSPVVASPFDSSTSNAASILSAIPPASLGCFAHLTLSSDVKSISLTNALFQAQASLQASIVHLMQLIRQWTFESGAASFTQLAQSSLAAMWSRRIPTGWIQDFEVVSSLLSLSWAELASPMELCILLQNQLSGDQVISTELPGVWYQVQSAAATVASTLRTLQQAVHELDLHFSSLMSLDDSICHALASWPGCDNLFSQLMNVATEKIVSKSVDSLVQFSNLGELHALSKVYPVAALDTQSNIVWRIVQYRHTHQHRISSARFIIQATEDLLDLMSMVQPAQLSPMLDFQDIPSMILVPTAQNLLHNVSTSCSQLTETLPIISAEQETLVLIEQELHTKAEQVVQYKLSIERATDEIKQLESDLESAQHSKADFDRRSHESIESAQSAWSAFDSTFGGTREFIELVCKYSPRYSTVSIQLRDLSHRFDVLCGHFESLFELRVEHTDADMLQLLSELRTHCQILTTSLPGQLANYLEAPSDVSWASDLNCAMAAADSYLTNIRTEHAAPGTIVPPAAPSSKLMSALNTRSHAMHSWLRLRQKLCGLDIQTALVSQSNEQPEQPEQTELAPAAIDSATVLADSSNQLDDDDNENEETIESVDEFGEMQDIFGDQIDALIESSGESSLSESQRSSLSSDSPIDEVSQLPEQIEEHAVEPISAHSKVSSVGRLVHGPQRIAGMQVQLPADVAAELVLKQASSIDVLSQMFEGWSAWF